MLTFPVVLSPRFFRLAPPHLASSCLFRSCCVCRLRNVVASHLCHSFAFHPSPILRRRTLRNSDSRQTRPSRSFRRPPPPKMGAVRGRASPTLSLALLVLLAFAQLASASFASIKAQQDKDKPQAPPTYGGQEIVPGSFLIEVGGSSLSKRASGAAVRFLRVSRPSEYSLTSLDGSGPHTSPLAPCLASLFNRQTLLASSLLNLAHARRSSLALQRRRRQSRRSCPPSEAQGRE